MKVKHFFIIILLIGLSSVSFADMPKEFWPLINSEQTTKTCQLLDGTELHLSGQFNIETGAPIRVTGGFNDADRVADNSTESVMQFIDHHRELFKIPTTQMEILWAGEVKGKSIFTARQLIDQRPVLGTKIILRAGESGKVMVWGSDVHDVNGYHWTSSLGEDQAVSRFKDFLDSPDAKLLETSEVWIRKDGKLVPAFRVHLFGAGVYLSPVGLIHADSGELLGLGDQLFNANISGAVQGYRYPNNAFDEPELVPITNQYVNIEDQGVEVTTNADGNYEITDLEAQVYDVEMVLAGPYFVVQDLQWDMRGNPMEPYRPFPVTMQQAAPGELDYTWQADSGQALTTAINVYSHANLVHDWWVEMDPDMDFLDETVCILPDQTGQMFEDNAGFQPAMQGYPAMIVMGRGRGNHARYGTISEILYHEFNHGVTFGVMPGEQNDNTYRNMHEGFADYFACTIKDRPEVGLGFLLDDPDTPIRSLDNEFVYPDDMEEDAHHNGLIMGGAMWDARGILGAEIVDELFHYARYGQPDDFEDYFVEVLILDDDNENLEDGTPHFGELMTAFNAHGLGLAFQSAPRIERSNLPTTPILIAAFPNPFNSSTTISFTLPRARNASLKLYDPLGRFVKELTPQRWMQAGDYSVGINASELASGLYILRMNANDQIFTKKLICVK